MNGEYRCYMYNNTQIGHTLCKGYRPSARGYVIYSARALPEGALARIPQGMQKYTEEKFHYCSSFFCFSTLHAGTNGIHKFLGLLIMLIF